MKVNKKVLTINPENGKQVLKTFIDNETNAKGREDIAYSAKAVDNIIKTLDDSKANIAGNINNDFNTKNITVSGTIIPSKSGLNIGTSENRFSSIYVDEAYLSTNTLYLGDTPVMGTDKDTIIIKSDIDQSVTIKTTGNGKSSIISENGVNLSTSGPNADVIVQAKGSGSRAVLSANNNVDINSPYINITGDANIHGPLRTKGLTIDGDMVVNGETFTVNSTTVQTKDNIIEVNYGQVGNGVSSGQAGIKINRGDSSPYYMVFDETDDMFKVGTNESLETIATQKYVNDNTYVHPNDSNTRHVTDAQIKLWDSKAAGNHDHNDTYLKLSGGTLNGDLLLTDGNLKLGVNPDSKWGFVGNNISNTWLKFYKEESKAEFNIEEVYASNYRIYHEGYKPKPADIGAAATSHGLHVPTTQVANSRIFLRNDNTWQTLPTATISDTGIVQLNDNVNSTSIVQAATANAVKKCYDLANSKSQIITSETKPSGISTGRVWIELL